MKIKVSGNQAINLMKTLNEAVEIDKDGQLLKFLKMMNDPAKELFGKSSLQNPETTTPEDTPANSGINVADSSLYLNPLGVGASITQGFRSGHPAVDFKVQTGTRIYAPDDGVVEIAGFLPNNDCGGTIKLKHDRAGLQTTYCHLSKWYVRQGQSVKKGTLIGLTGGDAGSPYAGHSTGAHLHYQIKDMNDNPINPNQLTNV